MQNTSSNCTFSLRVSEDRMAVYADLRRIENPDPVAIGVAIAARLRDLQVVVPMLPVDIEKAFQQIDNDKLNISSICVATGTMPTPGQNGSVEFLVDLDFSPTPAVQGDGRADYYQLHLFENVSAGQILARLHPPQTGVEGFDVFGQRVAAPNGTPVSLLAGDGIRMSSSDDITTFASTIDGQVHLVDNILFVQRVLSIMTDVDFHTGNIDFNGDIDIQGDVRSGFSIKAQGTVHVRGVVEDARVHAGDSIVIRSGFVGQGKGRIEAGRDVILGYVRNQTVIARRSIMVCGESIDAVLCAGEKILVESRKCGIIGGRAVARDGISAQNIGSPNDSLTSICVGIDYTVNVKLNRLRTAIEDLEEEIKAITAACIPLRSAQSVDTVKLQQRANLESSLLDGNRRMQILLREQEELRKHLYTTATQVRVLGTVHPNVIIEIAGSYPYNVTSIMNQCMFFFKDGEVQKQSLTTH